MSQTFCVLSDTVYVFHGQSVYITNSLCLSQKAFPLCIINATVSAYQGLEDRIQRAVPATAITTVAEYKENNIYPVSFHRHSIFYLKTAVFGYIRRVPWKLTQILLLQPSGNLPVGRPLRSAWPSEKHVHPPFFIGIVYSTDPV